MLKQTKEISKDITLMTTMIVSDSLYSEYNFRDDICGTGHILIPEDFIIRLKNKQLYSYIPEINTAKDLLNLIEEVDEHPEEKEYNFVLQFNNRKIKLYIGSNLLIIKNNIELYRDYLKELETGMEYVVKFSFV